MAKYDQYHPNYEKLYPGVELTPELLDFLDKSDRKIEYAEVDLKVERFVQDQKRKVAVFFPSREDSYDRLLEEDRQFTQDELSPEAAVLHADELRRLRLCMALLSDNEQELIQALYFEGSSESALSARMGISQQLINYRKQKILGKLKKLLEIQK